MSIDSKSKGMPKAGKDPGTWWKNNSMNFPRLALCAREMFAMQATNSESERSFSLGGHIRRARRSALTSNTLFCLTNAREL